MLSTSCQNTSGILFKFKSLVSSAPMRCFQPQYTAPMRSILAVLAVYFFNTPHPCGLFAALCLLHEGCKTVLQILGELRHIFDVEFLDWHLDITRTMENVNLQAFNVDDFGSA
jgi:hypothetical protein